MKQVSIMGGFTDLKEMLIEKYNIQKPKHDLRLYFTLIDSQLKVHDYHQHEYSQLIFIFTEQPIVQIVNSTRTQTLLVYAIEQSKNPAEFLNELFLRHGFFRF